MVPPPDEECPEEELPPEEDVEPPDFEPDEPEVPEEPDEPDAPEEPEEPLEPAAPEPEFEPAATEPPPACRPAEPPPVPPPEPEPPAAVVTGLWEGLEVGDGDADGDCEVADSVVGSPAATTDAGVLPGSGKRSTRLNSGTARETTTVRAAAPPTVAHTRAPGTSPRRGRAGRRAKVSLKRPVGLPGRSGRGLRRGGTSVS
ncbi:hypothetical protein AB0958_33200 [Streptomyces sp. NPDC006655]|uniref:hypothetical protein n=1 Tax=Streptomyces sp. NPDC006655 TaxID=3156898 RepID=UPI00345709CF